MIVIKDDFVNDLMFKACGRVTPNDYGYCWIGLSDRATESIFLYSDGSWLNPQTDYHNFGINGTPSDDDEDCIV